MPQYKQEVIAVIREVKLEAADPKQSAKLNSKLNPNCTKVGGKWKSQAVKVVK